jgi:predicted transcriptional regulator
MTKYIAIIILQVVLLASVGYIGYIKGEAGGKAAAVAEYNTVISEYKAAIDAQAETLNKALNIQGVDLSKQVSILMQDTKAIKQAIKEPVVVIREGKCEPSKELLDARRKMIERVNQ